MSQNDERAVDRSAAEQRVQMDQLRSRIEGLAKDQRIRAEDARRAAERARVHAIVRALGVILVSALFACTMGPWLTVPASSAGVDGWALSGTGLGVGGQVALCLLLLILTILLASWAALSFSTAAGVTAAIGGALLLIAEISLHASIDNRLTQGYLTAQGSGARIGPGFVLLFVLTVLLVIWAIATAVNARQLAE